MRKIFAVLAVALGLAVSASAQTQLGVVTPIKVKPISANKNAADNTPALVIKYYAPAGVATPTSATTVATAATDLRFVVNGVAYAGFEAPVSGALGGIIDLTDASANTLGEVVDIINSTPTSFSTGYFRAVIGAGLRADVVSTLAFVADAADSDVSTPVGEVIYWDSSILDDDDLLFAQYGDARDLLGPRGVPATGPFGNSNIVIQYERAVVTNGGTVGDTTVYAISEVYGSGGGCNSSTDCGQGSETVRVIAVFPAASATEQTSSVAFPQGMLASGEKVFVRIDSSGADTSVWSLQLSGFAYPKQ
jgi:hypothetical protein